jgi:hypothetical protein
LLVPGTDVTPALGALAPRLIDDGSVNDPMTLAKRVDVTYPVYAPKWRHPVEAATEDPHRRSRHKPAIFPRGNVGTAHAVGWSIVVRCDLSTVRRKQIRPQQHPSYSRAAIFDAR